MDREPKQLITPELYENVLEAFSAFINEDEDIKTANLDVDKLEPALRYLGLNPSKEDIEDMKEDVQGKIPFETFLFLVYYHQRAINVENDLIEAFSIKDYKNTGTLPIDLIKQILRNLDTPFSEEQINSILQKTKKRNNQVDYTNLVENILYPD